MRMEASRKRQRVKDEEVFEDVKVSTQNRSKCRKTIAKSQTNHDTTSIHNNTCPLGVWTADALRAQKTYEFDSSVVKNAMLRIAERVVENQDGLFFALSCRSARDAVSAAYKNGGGKMATPLTKLIGSKSLFVLSFADKSLAAKKLLFAVERNCVITSSRRYVINARTVDAIVRCAPDEVVESTCLFKDSKTGRVNIEMDRLILKSCQYGRDTFLQRLHAGVPSQGEKLMRNIRNACYSKHGPENLDSSMQALQTMKKCRSALAWIFNTYLFPSASYGNVNVLFWILRVAKCVFERRSEEGDMFSKFFNALIRFDKSSFATDMLFKACTSESKHDFFVDLHNVLSSYESNGTSACVELIRWMVSNGLPIHADKVGKQLKTISIQFYDAPSALTLVERLSTMLPDKCTTTLVVGWFKNLGRPKNAVSFEWIETELRSESGWLFEMNSYELFSKILSDRCFANTTTIQVLEEWAHASSFVSEDVRLLQTSAWGELFFVLSEMSNTNQKLVKSTVEVLDRLLTTQYESDSTLLIESFDAAIRATKTQESKNGLIKVMSDCNKRYGLELVLV